MLQVMNSLKLYFLFLERISMKLFLFMAFYSFVVESADSTQERKDASAYALVDVVHAAQDVEIVLQLHLHLQPQQLKLHLRHVKTNGKPKNVTRGKIRGTVPRKRSRKTARKHVKFANSDMFELK